jgi:hypothetical protein
MTRRTILPLFGLAPALKALPASQPGGLLEKVREFGREISQIRPESVERKPSNTMFGTVDGPIVRKSIFPDWFLPEDLRSLIHEYDPNGGMLGRGHQLPVADIRKLLPRLRSYGFEAYMVPGLSGSSARYHPVYGCDGGLQALTWFGFVRQYNGRNEIAAFEVTSYEASLSYANTGRSLSSIIEDQSPSGH